MRNRQVVYTAPQPVLILDGVVVDGVVVVLVDDDQGDGIVIQPGTSSQLLYSTL